MAENNLNVTAEQLTFWPDAQVQRAWPLATAIVRCLNTRPEDDAERLTHLPTVEEDAALFGFELMSRGLI